MERIVELLRKFVSMRQSRSFDEARQQTYGELVMASLVAESVWLT